MVMSMVIFGIMLVVVMWGHGQPLEKPPSGILERTAAAFDPHAGRKGLGANLDAPADPSKPYPARPEWYFLFLFQLLKYFPGDQEVVGTIVIPNVALVGLALLPLFGYGRLRRFGHLLGVVV